ncbi:DUF2637 domain-containing protein [Streptomyces sp. TRM76130]|nr:DUF2637 domain-containing protein [Streptomyces sp. TRM76130]
MAEERFTRHTVTVVMAVIAVLAFVFSFGNVWALALRLGVPRPIAPLIAPMVDLSVVGLLIALRYLALRGVPKTELKAGTRLLHLCGLLTLALNTAEPLLTGRYGRACLDTVAPLLLLGWGHVGPAFLAHFHTTARLEDARCRGRDWLRGRGRRPGSGHRSGHRLSDGRGGWGSCGADPGRGACRDRGARLRPRPGRRQGACHRHPPGPARSPAECGPAHRGHPPRRARNAGHRRPARNPHGRRPAGGHRRPHSALSRPTTGRIAPPSKSTPTRWAWFVMPRAAPTRPLQ